MLIHGVLSHWHCLPAWLQSFGRNGRVAGRDPQGSPPLLNKSSGIDESLLHLCTADEHEWERINVLTEV